MSNIRSYDDNEKVEEYTERCDTDDNNPDGDAGLPKITGESATEKQQRGLQDQRQRPHHIVKIPYDNAV